MSPLPTTGRISSEDPVYGAAPAGASLDEAFPVSEVDPAFLEKRRNDDAAGEEPVGRSVTDHLEAAIVAADAAGMTTSELIGTFFYYAHSLAQEAREAALQAMD